MRIKDWNEFLINYNYMKRRHFIQLAAAGIPATFIPFGEIMAGNRETKNLLPPKVKISLNAYSFNQPLLAGDMTINDMLDFAAQTGLEGVDITGYYFKGYPAVPRMNTFIT